MKLSFDLKNLTRQLRQNIGLSLGVGLLVLLAAEGLIVKQSISLIIQSQHVEITPPTKLVRVNFGLYDSIAQQFSQEVSFTPTPVAAINPFDIPPTK